MIKNYTSQDLSDLTEGMKRRPPRKWKKTTRLTADQKLINKIIDNRGEVDTRSLAKKYNKTTSDIIKIINDLGLY